MIRFFSLLFLYLGFVFSPLWAQNTGILTGTVRDKNTQELLVGVAVAIEGTSTGSITDLNGYFKIAGVPTGSYNIQATFVGYKPTTKYNIVVTSGNVNELSFEMEEAVSELGEIQVVADRSASVATIETPNSIQRLTTEEIRSKPGGNFDISRVVQVLPGVGGTSGSVGGFRNDIIIRGGAPNENVYYLDGIEIPVINHFATQGSAGGPTGILNVSFIEDVTLSSSGFDARYDNALSSVFQFKQKEGSLEKFQGNVRLSATELALTNEGHIGKKTTFLTSVRRSYLQFLFQAIDLPIRPNYWDFQYKVVHRFNSKTTLTAIGVGAIDEFSFAVPRRSTPEKEYALRSNPSINQWNYTIGLSLKHLINNGYWNIALSRNVFDNALDRFEDNQQGDESRRMLKARSQEIENKLRIDVNKFNNGWKYSFGVMAQFVEFGNSLFNRLQRQIVDVNNVLLQPEILITANTQINFFRFGAFGQVSKGFFGNRLNLSLGVRTDMNTFTTTGMNPLETFSPRFSASYAISDKWTVSASIGRYYKIPIYTVLGFRDASGTLVNRDNRYMQSDHLVTGIEFLPRPGTRITLEGFYKQYNDYPVSIREGVSLANQGGNFGAIGNEQVFSSGKGRSYGIEIFFQQKLVNNLFFAVSYTLFKSEFSGLDPNRFIASAWDTRHLLSGLLGRKFKRGWEIGLRYRFAGGAPFTPFDLIASQRNYASLGVGVLDLARYNTERLGSFNQFDFRVDKKWNFRGFTLDLFLDVSNALVLPNPAFPQYTFQRLPDNSGFATTDGTPLRSDGSNAIPLILRNDDPTVLPTLGFIIEY
ncbi:MAG TPA: TonB-dependent receptor [Microscillaceae bacterium]|nr:TonB-dependent receptor [Microscillaceae bacterium]